MSFVTRSRIYAIGDLHGDLDVLQSILHSVGLVDSLGSWIGEDAVLVLVGDFIYETYVKKYRIEDRYKYEMIKYIDNIAKQALNQSGLVLAVIGNHEYRLLKKNTGMKLPNQTYGIVKVNNVVFAHGGLNEKLFESFNTLLPSARSIEDIVYWANRSLKSFREGTLSDSESKLLDLFYNNMSTSIVWDRTFSQLTTEIVCPKSESINIDGLVFVLSHTIQSMGLVFPNTKPYQTGWILAHVIEHDKAYEFTLPAIKFPQANSNEFVPHLINFICEGRVWRIDTGMSRSHDPLVHASESLAARFPQVLCFDNKINPSVFVSKSPVKRVWISTQDQLRLLRSFIQKIQSRLGTQ